MKRLNFVALVIMLFGIFPKASGQLSASLSLPNATTGKALSFGGISTKALAIIFLNGDCPYDSYYINRIKKLNEQFSDNVYFVLINSKTTATVATLKKQAVDFSIQLPYLLDTAQLAMSALQASKSTEAFLLKKDDQTFQIIYNGSIDNSPQVEEDADQSYFANAITEFLSGKSITVSSTRPVGCSIQ